MLCKITCYAYKTKILNVCYCFTVIIMNYVPSIQFRFRKVIWSFIPESQPVAGSPIGDQRHVYTRAKRPLLKRPQKLKIVNLMKYKIRSIIIWIQRPGPYGFLAIASQINSFKKVKLNVVLLTVSLMKIMFIFMNMAISLKSIKHKLTILNNEHFNLSVNNVTTLNNVLYKQGYQRNKVDV